MTTKSVSKSIRMTEEVNTIVMKQPGEGFNQKFGNMVLEYERSVPIRSAKLKEINKDISLKEKELETLEKKINAFSKISYSLSNLVITLDCAYKNENGGQNND